MAECSHFRGVLLDDQHGRLAGEPARELHAHLHQCASCAEQDREDRWLIELLRTWLPRPHAPDAFRDRLLAELSTVRPPLRAAVREHAWILGLAAVAALAVGGALYVLPGSGPKEAPSAVPEAAPSVVREAVNDHLRVIYAERPVEVESAGMHQVTPWFSGRLDFAPDVAFSGDANFSLVGGAVGYFVDRKAAMLMFKRRMHTITCFVFRAKDLPWPRASERRLDGGPRAHVTRLDGFRVVLWRDADLGHALVSDVSEGELLELATKLARD
jgi:anti-sigma factor RsiW